MNIVLFGPPGSGKGTQSKRLIEKYNLEYISTGDVIRDQIAKGTKLGLKVKSLAEQGVLIPDELVVSLLECKMNESTNVKGFLLDGFPRTHNQAEALDIMLKKLNSKVNIMLALDVPKNELSVRLLNRAKIEGRKDDNEEVILKRFREYEDKTMPVIEFYKKQNKYRRIDGLGSPDVIFKRLTEFIDSLI